jgi:hypothetical protein
MPPTDSLQVSACALLKAEARPDNPGKASYKLDSKKTPKSVKPFLKVSGLIDFHDPKVRKAAQKILKKARSLGGAKADKDPEILLKSVLGWMEENLAEAASNSLTAEFCSDWRKAWPKASLILKKGKADATGRARVGVALLRALGVPSRPCWVGGVSRIQAWMQFKAAAQPRAARGAKKKKNLAKVPLGRWVVAGGLRPGEAVDSYSFDLSELAALRWSPDQDLKVADLGAGRAYYSMTEAAQAEADFAALTATGALPPACLSRLLLPAPEKGDQPWEYLALTCHRYALSAEGPMDPLNELEVMLPYVPHLKSWGYEEIPAVSSLEKWKESSEALWTDRPERLRNGAEGVRDEWKSPPPALGTQHYLSAYFRRPPDILEAALKGLTLTGQVVRSDSLQKRDGIKVRAEFLNLTTVPEVLLTPDAAGKFETILTASPTGPSCLKVWAVQDRDGETLKKDSLILDGNQP